MSYVNFTSQKLTTGNNILLIQYYFQTTFHEIYKFDNTEKCSNFGTKDIDLTNPIEDLQISHLSTKLNMQRKN